MEGLACHSPVELKSTLATDVAAVVAGGEGAGVGVVSTKDPSASTPETEVELTDTPAMLPAAENAGEQQDSVSPTSSGSEAPPPPAADAPASSDDLLPSLPQVFDPDAPVVQYDPAPVDEELALKPREPEPELPEPEPLEAYEPDAGDDRMEVDDVEGDEARGNEALLAALASIQQQEYDVDGDVDDGVGIEVEVDPDTAIVEGEPGVEGEVVAETEGAGESEMVVEHEDGAQAAEAGNIADPQAETNEESHVPPDSPLTPLSDIAPLPSGLEFEELSTAASTTADAGLAAGPTPAPEPAPAAADAAESSTSRARRSVSPRKASGGSAVEGSGVSGPSNPAPEERGQKRKLPSRGARDRANAASSAAAALALATEEEFEEGAEKLLKGPNGKKILKTARKRKRLDQSLGIVRDSQKPSEKVAPRAQSLTDAKLRQLVKGQTSELQLAPCLRPRYHKRSTKCCQCVSKVGGDQCRFRHYRSFPLDPETAEIIGKPYFESTKFEDEMTPLPRDFSSPLTPAVMLRTQRTVAPLLLGLISQELRHIVTNPKTIFRGVDAAKNRSVCDFCASTIFAGFFFCKQCGRDYCMLCERHFPDDEESLLKAPWPLPVAALPRLIRCATKKNHYRPDLQPTSRFTEAEMRQTWHALLEFVLDPKGDMTLEERFIALGLGEDETELRTEVEEILKKRQTESASSPVVITEDEIQALYDASKETPRVDDPAELESLPFMYIDTDKLDNDKFDVLWGRGEPMVAYGTQKKFKLDWSPDAFIERFGTEQCMVFDCETDQASVMTIGHFFTVFKDPWAKYINPDEGKDDAKQRRSTRSPSVAATRAASRPSRSTSPLKQSAQRPQPSSSQGDVEMTDAQTRPTEAELSGATDKGPGANAATEPKTSNSHDEDGDAKMNGDGSTGPTSSAVVNGNGTRTNEKDGANGASNTTDVDGSATGTADKAEKRVLKLKDWPSTNDFQSAYPALYNDFCDALPVPDYTRRNGVLNLYAHFPPGPTRPDIGPKMYNAFAANEGPGGKGSTRLHMDVADAVNIMLYASPREDGSPGCAVWDLFRAEDADTIRQFLKDKYAAKYIFADPIHAQLFYLDSDLRKELFERHGVKSFRVYQRPGEAVFIPAGCAHQVANLSNCIKIALDFVSPHNVRRCQQLGQDFRKENFVKAWKDDVLQLYNVMWYAWSNVLETRERDAKETAKAEVEEAKRRARLEALASGNADHSYSFMRHSPVPSRFLPQTSSVRDDPAPAPSPGTSSPGVGVNDGGNDERGEGAGAAGRRSSAAGHDQPDGPQPTTLAESLEATPAAREPEKEDAGSTAPKLASVPPESGATEANTEKADGTQAAKPQPSAPTLADRLLAAALARNPTPVLQPPEAPRKTPTPPSRQASVPREKVVGGESAPEAFGSADLVLEGAKDNARLGASVDVDGAV